MLAEPVFPMPPLEFRALLVRLVTAPVWNGRGQRRFRHARGRPERRVVGIRLRFRRGGGDRLRGEHGEFARIGHGRGGRGNRRGRRGRLGQRFCHRTRRWWRGSRHHGRHVLRDILAGGLPLVSGGVRMGIESKTRDRPAFLGGKRLVAGRRLFAGGLGVAVGLKSSVFRRFLRNPAKSSVSLKVSLGFGVGVETVSGSGGGGVSAGVSCVTSSLICCGVSPGAASARGNHWTLSAHANRTSRWIPTEPATARTTCLRFDDMQCRN